MSEERGHRTEDRRRQRRHRQGEEMNVGGDDATEGKDA